MKTVYHMLHLFDHKAYSNGHVGGQDQKNDLTFEANKKT